MPDMMRQLAFLAREAQWKGECSRVYGNHVDASYWFEIEERADALADVLYRAFGQDAPS